MLNFPKIFIPTDATRSIGCKQVTRVPNTNVIKMLNVNYKIGSITQRPSTNSLVNIVLKNKNKFSAFYYRHILHIILFVYRCFVTLNDYTTETDEVLRPIRFNKNEFIVILNT